MNPHRYCVVMCGGVGTRFWPFSRSSMPKQFLDFFGTGRSLLQMTVDRIRSLVDPSRIILVTNSAYASIIREQLPDIKESNILLEPARRNTAPCLCWAARHIQALDSEASIVALPSDHLILKEDVFRQTLEDGFDFVEKGDRLLTLGLNPTAPATGSPVSLSQIRAVSRWLLMLMATIDVESAPVLLSKFLVAIMVF